MRKLMSQEPLACRRVRHVSAGSKDDVMPDGVRMGSDRAGRGRGFCLGVHPHSAEIVAEARLEVAARRRIERVTAIERRRQAGRGGCVACTAAVMRRLSLGCGPRRSEQGPPGGRFGFTLGCAPRLGEAETAALEAVDPTGTWRVPPGGCIAGGMRSEHAWHCSSEERSAAGL